MDPISAFAGFLASFLASALHAASEKRDSECRIRRASSDHRLYEALRLARPSEQELENAIASTFRSLSPVEAYNQFDVLFDDLEFREHLLRWMLTLEKEERDRAFQSLESRAAERMRTAELGKQAAAVISRAFESMVHSNKSLAEIISREDRNRILEGVQATAHNIEAHFHNASEQLQQILERIAALERASTTDSRQLVEEIGRYSDNVLRGVRTDLPIIGSIERIEESQTLRFALEEATIMLQGEAGAGKTGIVARLARALRRSGECVLFVKADSLARQFADRCTASELSDALGFEKPLTELLHQATTAAGRAWFIIDQFDQVAGEAVGAAFIQVINRLRGRSGCTIIVACRSYEAQSSAFIEDLNLPRLIVSTLAPEEVCRCLRRLNLSPEIDLVRFCGNLLNLFLLASLVQEGAAVSSLTAEGQLWRKLSEHLSQDRVRGLLEAACTLAAQAAIGDGGRFHSADDSRAKRLASWGILTGFPGEQYAFRHEQLRDYFVAFDSVRKRESLPELLMRIPKARSKTIVPWLIRISAAESPTFCAGIIGQVFDRTLVESNFPRRACIDSISSIEPPTPEVATAVWQTAIENPSHVHELLRPFETHDGWALAFWDAGVFNAAISVSEASEPCWAASYLFDCLPLILRHRPDEFFAWIDGLDRCPPRHSRIIKALALAPRHRVKSVMGKVLTWLRQSLDTDSCPLFELAAHVSPLDDGRLTLQLLEVATEPVIRQSRDPNDNCSYIISTCDTVFMHSYFDDSVRNIEATFGVHPDQLLTLLNAQIRRLRELAGEATCTHVGDAYAYWGCASILRAHGMHKGDDSWLSWYGAMRQALCALVARDPALGAQRLTELLGSDDLLQVRIALSVLPECAEDIDKLVTVARGNDCFRRPSTIGESLAVLATLIRAGAVSDAVELIASDLAHAIVARDRSRDLRLDCLPDDVLRWAESVAFHQASDSASYVRRVAAFALAHADVPTLHQDQWTFRECAVYCDACVENEAQWRCMRTGFDGTRWEDASEVYLSLHVGADRLRDTICKRFEELFSQGIAEGSPWVTEPIGYAVLLGAQWRIDSHAQSLRAKQRGREPELDNAHHTPRTADGTLPLDALLEAYEPALQAESRWAPAIRGQLAGLLAMLAYELPIAELRARLPKLRTMLVALISCADDTYVRTWCRAEILQTARPLRASAVAVFGLKESMWRARFGDRSRVDLLSRKAHPAPRREENDSAISASDVEALDLALQRGSDENPDVLCVLGSQFVELAELVPTWSSKLLGRMQNAELECVQLFVSVLVSFSCPWNQYALLRPIYKRIVAEGDGKVPTGLICQIGYGYVIGVEELSGDGSFFFRLWEQGTDDVRALLCEAACESYDVLGREERYWQRVRSLWAHVASLSGSGTNRALSAFGRCLWCETKVGHAAMWFTGRVMRTGSRMHGPAHVPEPIDSLLPLLEKTCVALGKGSGNDSVVAYLAKQCLGYEEVAVRLLHWCAGVGSDRYHKEVVQSEAGREILRRAITRGGESKRLASEIIEHHELASDSSLAGLLL